MTTPDELRALARELCEAQEGSESLDWRILEHFGNPSYDINTCPPEMWRVVDRGNYRPLPFTTSLDAALPCEDIASMTSVPVWLAGGRKKYHVTTTSRTNAAAWAEPLARRAAALLAMAERMEQ